MYQKYFVIILSSLVMVTQLIGATVPLSRTQEIQSLIKQVKVAPPEQRRVLINALKVKLKSVNKAHRTTFMLELRKAFSTHSYGRHIQTQKYSHMSQQHNIHMGTEKHKKKGDKKGDRKKGDTSKGDKKKKGSDAGSKKKPKKDKRDKKSKRDKKKSKSKSKSTQKRK